MKYVTRWNARQEIAHLGKYHSENCSSGTCLFEELSVGEKFVEEMSIGEGD